jgi:hypothetical protein
MRQILIATQTQDVPPATKDQREVTVMTPYERLLKTFERFRLQVPRNLVAALGGLPGPTALPPPGVTWTLVVLARYRQSQCWARQVTWRQVVDHLDLVNPWHSGQTQFRGEVPGFDDWVCDLDLAARRCQLRHKATGQVIAIDPAPEDSESPIPVPDFVVHLGRCQPGGPEARFRELNPSKGDVSRAVGQLLGAGLLESVDGTSLAVRFSAPVIEDLVEITGFGDAWAESEPQERVWMAAIIGDWPAAIATARNSGQTGLAAAVEAHAERFHTGTKLGAASL